MDPRQLYTDERLYGHCVFCGGGPDTRDHVPSKALLDDPLPDDLPVVDACLKCNQGFSADEEYFACFLEAVMCGTTSIQELGREKVRRTLGHSTRLVSRIENSKTVGDGGQLSWVPEMDRVRSVVLKLACGHAAFELGVTQLEGPDFVLIQPLVTMSDETHAEFARAGSGEVRGWPEVGSRAFLRACGAEPSSNSQGPWVTVQPGRYRYAVDEHGGVNVRIVIGEYLACQVGWG